MEEKIHEANSSYINQIRHNKEENPDIEGIYGYIIRQIIGHGSQNQNQESSDANGIDFARNNNVNEDSVNTTEECTNVQFHECKSNYWMLTLSNGQTIWITKIKVCELRTKNMLIITEVKREPEIISKELPKDNNDGDN